MSGRGGPSLWAICKALRFSCNFCEQSSDVFSWIAFLALVQKKKINCILYVCVQFLFWQCFTRNRRGPTLPYSCVVEQEIFPPSLPTACARGDRRVGTCELCWLLHRPAASWSWTTHPDLGAGVGVIMPWFWSFSEHFIFNF